MTAQAARSALQGAAQAGPRLVAVGERGIIVVSDDGGLAWRQVPVPVSVGLTAVRFVDARQGWVVGHGGVVLATRDGGETWIKQLDGVQAAQLVLRDAQARGHAPALAEAERLVADGADKPLLDLHFFDTRRGLVIGAYNLAFTTEDGGNTWQPLSARLDNPRALHLYALRVREQVVLIVGEQGLVLRSADGGRSFQRLTLPYQGSFFTAEMPREGHLVVAGLRGNVWQSQDDGASWRSLKTPVPVSFTASALDAQGRLWLANQAGGVFMLTGDALTPLPGKRPPLNGLLPLGPQQALGLSVVGAVPVPLMQGAPK